MKKFLRAIADGLMVRQPGAAPAVPVTVHVNVPKTSVPMSVINGSFHVAESPDVQLSEEAEAFIRGIVRAVFAKP